MNEGGLLVLRAFLGPVLPPGKIWQTLARMGPSPEPSHLLQHLTPTALLHHMRTPGPEEKLPAQGTSWQVAEPRGESMLADSKASPPLPHRICLTPATR